VAESGTESAALGELRIGVTGHRVLADVPRVLAGVEEALDRIDACWAGAMGLGPIDHIRGGHFQARGLALALEAGEPFRIVRALAHETIYVANRGNRNLAATQRILATTRALAEKLGEPDAEERRNEVPHSRSLRDRVASFFTGNRGKK